MLIKLAIVFAGKCVAHEGEMNMRKMIACLLAGVFICLTGCSYNGADEATSSASSGDNTIHSQVALSTTSSKNGSGTVEYYFPRGGQPPEPVLVNIINSSKSSLDIAIYSFTDIDIADAVVNAKKRGVAVRVISDEECSSDSSQKKVLKLLEKAGIPVKINTHSGLMHLKMTVADQDVATTGSFNYTKSAENQNDEVFVVIRDVNTAKNFDSQFVRMWNDNKDFADY
jgi:phosphatidylserine/phosphatidylglycerophosphate/cardiolipin synthase-like enzyme